MTKPTLDTPRQLSLDPAQKAPETTVDTPVTGRVVSFVDATTIAIRRDAIRRVRASGIFARPGDGRLKA